MLIRLPEYLYIKASELGEHKDGEKIVKVIAGKYEKAEGPEKNHNLDPIYFHVILNEGKEFNCDVPSGHNSFVYLLKGELKIGEQMLGEKDAMGVWETNGIDIEVTQEAKVLLIEVPMN